MKETWGKLTDDDLDRVDGRLDRLAGLLQSKYGYARDKAEEEIKQIFAEDDRVAVAEKEDKTPWVVSIFLAGLMFAGMSMGMACGTTDAGLTTKVKSKMVADGTVPASQINVDTKNGVVTLTGSVDRQTEKDQAILVARNTAGVKDVVDMISVRESSVSGNAPEPDRSMGERVDDAGITVAVKGRLLEDPDVKGLQIDVDTREGVVYLTGSVRSDAEKEKAASLARETKNVKNVVTNLKVEKS
jgi:hyperosmotically inducible protein